MIYLTYLPYVDGMGAQYQRVIGLIALAEFYGCIYVHTPIKQMEHVMPEEVILIETFLQIKSYYSKGSITFDTIYNVKNADIKSAIMNLKSNTSNILLCIDNPLALLDANTAMYDKIMPTLRKIKQSRELVYFKHNVLNIAVHIRRGDVSELRNTDRYLSTQYFKTIVDKLLLQYQDANVCIFTELTSENRHQFDIFNSLNATIVSAGDILTTFEHLTKADILITSKSSFSYLSALYNQNTVLYTPFWHKPLCTWGLNNS